MSSLLKCSFREEVLSCTNCNSKGIIYNYDIKCPCSSKEYVTVETYQPRIVGMPTAITQIGMEKTSKERKKRSQDHFKSEVYPTLAPHEKKIFAKKHNLKT